MFLYWDGLLGALFEAALEQSFEVGRGLADRTPMDGESSFLCTNNDNNWIIVMKFQSFGW